MTYIKNISELIYYIVIHDKSFCELFFCNKTVCTVSHTVVVADS